ncbi:MAG: hypothetical protein E7378_00010 [Clostridiales bacterium]|nr:hypothetical protein [Clostridiales bacterium]
MKMFSDESSLQDLIKMSIDKAKTMMETNTIYGEPYKVDDNTTIISVSKASVGLVVGGGEYSDKSNKRVANHYPMAGGSGIGMSVTPVGFIVISENDVKFIDIENKTAYQTILNLINKLISKIKDDKGEKNEKDI